MVLLPAAFKTFNSLNRSYFTFFLGGRGCVYSTSWKISLHFVYIFRTDWNFLIKFCSSDTSFDRNILTFLYLKFKTSVNVKVGNTHNYVLFTISWHDMNLKLTLEIYFDKWSFTKFIASKCQVYSWCKG